MRNITVPVPRDTTISRERKQKNSFKIGQAESRPYARLMGFKRRHLSLPAEFLFHVCRPTCGEEKKRGNLQITAGHPAIGLFCHR
jgi:hypothetical protein